MIVKTLKSFYIVNEIKEHILIKNHLLNLIQKIPQTPLLEKHHANISHSDWFSDKNNDDVEKEYLHFFYKIITPYMHEMSKFLCCKSWRVTNGWFQQYTTNDFHNWHLHVNSHYANVYYLELPSKEDKTQIFNVVDKTLINVDVKEGDVLTFPGYFIHRSKPLIGGRKTVIAFNSNFDDPYQNINLL